MSAASVFLLWHAYELEGRDEQKLIGAYSTSDTAKRAIDRLRSQPGFRDYPDAFIIEEYRIDDDHWTEGFITVR